LEYLHCDREVRLVHGVGEAGKRSDLLGDLPPAYKGAAPRPALNVALLGQFAQRLADWRQAHPKLPGIFTLGRQLSAGRQVTGQDLIQQHLLELIMDRNWALAIQHHRRSTH